jgi:hypothetical protein
MARPHKEPGKPRKRIQPWVSERLEWHLRKDVTASGIPMGDILDHWFKERAEQGKAILGRYKAQNIKPSLPEKPTFDLENLI